MADDRFSLTTFGFVDWDWLVPHFLFFIRNTMQTIDAQLLYKFVPLLCSLALECHLIVKY